MRQIFTLGIVLFLVGCQSLASIEVITAEHNPKHSELEHQLQRTLKLDPRVHLRLSIQEHTLQKLTENVSRGNYEMQDVQWDIQAECRSEKRLLAHASFKSRDMHVSFPDQKLHALRVLRFDRIPLSDLQRWLNQACRTTNDLHQ